MDIKRQEMYIRYVNKLCSLHLECDDFAEAAYTLKLHSDLLSWSNNLLTPLLRSPSRYPTCDTHRQLKETLYHDIIDYFDKGKVSYLLILNRYYIYFILIFTNINKYYLPIF